MDELTYEDLIIKDKASDFLTGGRNRIVDAMHLLNFKAEDVNYIYPKDMFDQNKNSFTIFLFTDEQIIELQLPRNEYDYKIIKRKVDKIINTEFASENGEYSLIINFVDDQFIRLDSLADTIQNGFKEEYKSVITGVLSKY
ncbi:DUF3908 family protein [Geomicrobium sp. JCM 19039]|uniref:DUF3908 family protein n=1 Tax=Geomicrobium sp. JCM 19039 TaxID=1460636 RepID=UPI001EE653EE|nr:DUF3908 family protein [Geomicrobium sp. JCM 19039]